ncbi:leucine-rich repeat domain-containing protein [Frondihabitans australicus]|uniref:Leucine rich repeat (LRR) protein n=1 Tax=Frondihabitans australicus TaxID=386892 RepID=A0A495IDD5_9MICO|nr:leucine-rich repeat domain-containing protein [Frondihabitans australicus]RKR73478.1 hypothetical protein C8E83_0571 [Frondihabitans australicus]
MPRAALPRARTVALAAAIAIGTVGLAAAPASAFADGTGTGTDTGSQVTIGDAALASCTADALGDDPSTTTFATSDLESLTALTCAGVGDASQLGLYSGLTSLDLDGSPIGDLTAIGTLTGLISLSLDDDSALDNDGAIGDLTPLGSLTNLTTLSLADDGLSDVKPLRPLQQLQHLDLEGNHISDLSPLLFLNVATITATDQTVTGPAETFGATLHEPVMYDRWDSRVEFYTGPGTEYKLQTNNDFVVTSTTSGSLTWTSSFPGFTGTYSFASALGILTPPTTGPGVAQLPAVTVKTHAAPGVWLPYQVNYGYQWFRNGVAIPGATSGSYTPKSSDLGAKLSYVVTVSLPDYATQTRTSPTYRVAGRPFTKTSAPAINGTTRVGHIVTATRGPWSPAGISFTYRWNRDGKPIAGATKSTYKLTSADAHHAITVTVTGAKSGYATTSRTSPAVKPTFH